MQGGSVPELYRKKVQYHLTRITQARYSILLYDETTELSEFHISDTAYLTYSQRDTTISCIKPINFFHKAGGQR